MCNVLNAYVNISEVCSHDARCIYVYCLYQFFFSDNTLSDILIYIQQDAKLHSLFYLETALHVLGGTIIHHQERKQLYLQHLVFVTHLLISIAIVGELEPV